MRYSVLLRVTLTMCVSALITLPSQALASDLVYTRFFSNIAVSGYDAVAYFTENMPVKGKPKFATKYQGAVWHFSNKENLQTFETAPEVYAPQYGGYCAWAIANGETVRGDPLQWALYRGKLYLNYDAKTQSKWLKNKANLVEAADKNWTDVL